jgi:hypothetical protein
MPLASCHISTSSAFAAKAAPTSVRPWERARARCLSPLATSQRQAHSRPRPLPRQCARGSARARCLSPLATSQRQAHSRPWPLPRQCARGSALARECLSPLATSTSSAFAAKAAPTLVRPWERARARMPFAVAPSRRQDASARASPSHASGHPLQRQAPRTSGCGQHQPLRGAAASNTTPGGWTGRAGGATYNSGFPQDDAR